MSDPARSIEDVLGPPPERTVEDVLGPKEIAQAQNLGGEYFDTYFANQAAGRILDVFGEGVKKGYGSDVNSTPEWEKWAKENDVWGSYKDAIEGTKRDIHDNLMRTSALRLDSVLSKTGEFVGALGGTAAQLGQLFIVDPLKAAGQALELGPEATPEEMFGAALFGVGGSVVRNSWRHLQFLEQAHDLGLTEEVPPGVTPREAARQSLAPTGVERPSEVVLPAEEPAHPTQTDAPVSAQTGQVSDVHVLARQIAPDTFTEYDALVDHHAMQSQVLDELGSQRVDLPRAQELQGRIDTTLGKVNRVEARLTVRAAERLARDRERLDTLLRTDTPEMAAVRADRETVDARMRELAPDVSAAYRDARDALPPAAGEPSATPRLDRIDELTADRLAAERGERAAGSPSQSFSAIAAQEPAAVPRSEIITGQEIRDRYTKIAPPEGIGLARGGDIYQDIEAAGAELSKQASDTLAAGGKVIMHVEGKERPVTEVRNGGLVDENGNRWGIGGFMMSPKDSIEFRPAAPTAEIYNLLQRRPTIAADVTRQLVAAGRPAEEARASAALVQAHYEARAARFNGALGSARDLYEAEDPVISRGEGRARGQLDLVRNQITLFKGADASTFVHETAHQWLEEIQRDALHERAPPDLKADLDTIREWLGTEGSISRAQHEKFARGFERYLMEGVAPSTRLAQVFAKFADWLKQLYQTVGRLRAPINDSVRGVYDRLLSAPRQEAVIAPEREVTLDFAGQHERDLATTSAEDAPKAAEQMAAEREQIAQIMRAEIANGRRRARAEGITRGGAEEGTGGTVVSPTAAEGGTGPGDVRADTAQEAGKVSPSGASFTAKSDVPTRADEPFIGGEGRLLDRNGEYRLDNVEAPEDVDSAIRQKVERDGGGPRTIPTDGNILDLADNIGMSPQFLNPEVVRAAWSAEEIRAGMEMLRSAETNVRDKMIQAAEGGDALELAQSIAQLEMIQAKMSSAASEWGYAGHALRALKEYTGGDLASILRETTGRSYDQLMQMARLVAGHEGTTTGQIGRFVYDTKGGKVKNAIYWYWMQDVLSGPFTHAVYAIGNTINALGEPIGTTVAAGVHQLRGGTDGVYWREVGASIFALKHGFESNLPLMKEAFRTGQNIPLPGEKGFGNPMGTFVSPFPNLSPWVTPTSYIAAIHQIGKGIRYQQGIARQAARTAFEENGVLDSIGAQSTDVTTRIAGLMQHPTDAMMEKAADNALTEMYMKPAAYNSTLGMISRALHRSVIGEFMFPFMNINFNIQKQTWLKMSPVGLASSEVRNQLLVREGGASFDNAAAKQMLGLGALATGVMWTAGGGMTGYGPPDPEQHRTWLEEGNVPYSFRVGNLNIPYKGLGPISGLFSFAADGWEAAHYIKPNEEHPFQKLAEHYTEAIARAVLDEGFFRELHDWSRIVNEPGVWASRWLQNFLPTWLPYSTFMSQVNRKFFDPYSKDVKDIYDGMRAHVPIASWYVPNLYDLFGNPRLTRDITFDRYADDPTMQYLRKMNIGVGALDKKIRGVELTKDQFNDYSRNAGVFTKQLLDRFVANPRHEAAPYGIQLSEIDKQIEAARAKARSLIIQQSKGTDNDILPKAREIRLKALQ